MSKILLEIKDETIYNSIVTLLGSVKWVTIDKTEDFSVKDRYNSAERWMINGIKELNAYNRWEVEFWDAYDFLKTL